MPKQKLKGTKTKGVWLMMLKPVKRHKQVLATSKLGILVEEKPFSPPTVKEFFGVPKFKKGLVFCITREGIYTVREINSTIEQGCYKLAPPPKPKKEKKNGKTKAAH